MRGYTIRGRGGRVKYVGITNNPAVEPCCSASDVKANVVGSRWRRAGCPERQARRWEGAKLARFRNKQQRPQPDLQQDQKRRLEVLKRWRVLTWPTSNPEDRDARTARRGQSGSSWRLPLGAFRLPVCSSSRHMPQ